MNTLVADDSKQFIQPFCKCKNRQITKSRAKGWRDETARWLRALAEEAGSVPSTHMVAHNSSLSPALGDPVPSADPNWHIVHI